MADFSNKRTIFLKPEWKRDALSVFQVHHIQFALQQRNRFRPRFRVRLVEVRKHLQLARPVGESRNRESGAPFDLAFVGFDDDRAGLKIHREYHAIL